MKKDFRTVFFQLFDIMLILVFSVYLSGEVRNDK